MIILKIILSKSESKTPSKHSEAENQYPIYLTLRIF